MDNGHKNSGQNGVLIKRKSEKGGESIRVGEMGEGQGSGGGGAGEGWGKGRGVGEEG